MSEQSKILKAMSRIDYVNQKYRKTVLLNRSSNYGFLKSYVQEIEIILDEFRALNSNLRLNYSLKEKLEELDASLDNFF